MKFYNIYDLDIEIIQTYLNLNSIKLKLNQKII